MQDEVSVSENFKVTGGLRFELPTYPSLEKDNYNEEFAKLDFGGQHYSTDQLPGAVSVSPRVGFNWDITGDRKYVLRGGTGLFVDVCLSFG